MLQPQDLRSIRLTQRPRGQQVLKDAFVRPSWWLRGVRIEDDVLIEKSQPVVLSTLMT